MISFMLLTSLAQASDCQNLMHTFFRQQKNNSLESKTAKIDITKYGLADTRVGRENFERLYLQCTTSNNKAITKPINQKFAALQFQLSMATTVVGYSTSNWQDPKDMQWFGKMFFGIAYGQVLGKVAGKLIVDNGNRFQYLVKDYLFTRAAVASYLVSSPLIFSNEKSEQQKIMTVKNSKNFKSDMLALKKYAENDDLLKRYQAEVMSYLSHLEFINLGLGIQQGVDFDKLTPADLKDKDIQKVVMAAIVAQEYENQKGPLNITKSNSGDFFLFDALYSIAKIPKDIAVTKVIDQVLCINALNPTRGLTQAIGISALNQIMFADFYGVTYRVAKKQFINQ